MGKIIRNGIEFCGTSDTADNIIYDNTNSGLAATNTQTAIDELTNKVKSGGNIVYLTQEEYDALPESKESDDVEYRITDVGSMGTAENVGYDNSKSGLAAVNVQDAIDKLDENLESKFAYIIDSFGDQLNVGTLVNYPQGFNRENTVVIAKHFNYDGLQLRDQYYANTLAMTVILHENAIEVSPRNEVAFGRNFKIALMRLF